MTHSIATVFVMPAMGCGCPDAPIATTSGTHSSPSVVTSAGTAETGIVSETGSTSDTGDVEPAEPWSLGASDADPPKRQAAHSAGLAWVDGHGMLEAQAARSFGLWTGRAPV